MTSIRRRHVWSWLVCVCASLCGLRSVTADSPGCSHLPAGFQSRTLEDSAGKHRYTVFTPRQYDASRKWPVVLFLHGAGEKGTDGVLPLFGMLSVALEKSPDLPFIAVFPQCEDLTSRALTGWLADSSDGQRAMKILAAVERDFAVDSQQRILAGWSMGGYGAWSLAAAHPETWSAVLVLAGGALHDTLSLQGLAEHHTPVWAISAKGDPLIPYQRSQKLIEQLNTLGGRGTFTLIDDDNHDICQRVFANPQTFQWLLNPDSISPASIDFQAVTPLPARTQFYSECLVETRVIPHSLALRLGNTSLRDFSAALPEVLQESRLSGTLADLRRTVGSGSDRMEIQLQQLNYQSRVTRILVHGISGGRLGLEVAFEPLQLTIGATSLQSSKHSARTGPIVIRIGIHEPAVLKLEVQPVMDQGELRLRLLRKSFAFDDGNWHIEPPREVQAHSEQFTADQLVTGIVGSLYNSREELVAEILGAVPGLLQQVEKELQLREAPALARLISPLPVLVPELQISPAQVRTDRQGLSALFDMHVAIRGRAVPAVPGAELSLQRMSAGDQLAADIALDSITTISQLNVDQDFAQINVLDISEDKFARLADPAVMNRVLPELRAPDSPPLTSILRLLSPMVVRKTAGAPQPNLLELELSTAETSIDVYHRVDPAAPAVPSGRIVFSLSQPIQIRVPEADEGQIHISWLPHCEVRFLRGESLGGSPVPEVDGGLFEQLFRDGWNAWGEQNGDREFSRLLRKVGQTELLLDRLKIVDRDLEVLFKTRQTISP